MKRILFLTITLLALSTIHSCKKEAENDQVNKVTAEKTNVSAFEMVNLIIHESIKDQYSAVFGTAEIQLIKTSDSTLSFLIPDVPAGEAMLEFELASIRFNVAQNPEVDMGQLVISVFEDFDIQVAAMNATTPEELADIDSLKQFKNRVLELINTLNPDQRRITGLFYDANSDIFDSFISSGSFKKTNEIDAMQDDCPNTDLKSKYTCIACKISAQADYLNTKLSVLRDILEKKGIEEIDPLLSGIYLRMAGVIPQIHIFRNNLRNFLNTKWILDDGLFNKIQTNFISDKYTRLNLDAGLRTVNDENDQYLLQCYNQGGPAIQRTFFENIQYLKWTWGFYNIPLSFPGYVNAYEAIGISFEESIEISNISNTSVQFVDGEGLIYPELKFKSISGDIENFSYNIKVSKEGFVEEKTVTGKVVPQSSCDPNSILGTWTVEMYNTCYPNPDGTPALSSINTLTLYQGGQSMFTYYDGSQVPGTYTINANDCSFTYDNLSWCSSVRAYPPSSPYYQSLYSCGCLSLKHIKQ